MLRQKGEPMPQPEIAANLGMAPDALGSWLASMERREMLRRTWNPQQSTYLYGPPACWGVTARTRRIQECGLKNGVILFLLAGVIALGGCASLDPWGEFGRLPPSRSQSFDAEITEGEPVEAISPDLGSWAIDLRCRGDIACPRRSRES
jgi:hypothetical protein